MPLRVKEDVFKFDVSVDNAQLQRHRERILHKHTVLTIAGTAANKHDKRVSLLPFLNSELQLITYMYSKCAIVTWQRMGKPIHFISRKWDSSSPVINHFPLRQGKSDSQQVIVWILDWSSSIFMDVFPHVHVYVGYVFTTGQKGWKLMVMISIFI